MNGAYADLNGDCLINVIDEQLVAYRHGAAFGLLLYDHRYDLQPQGNNYNWPPQRDSYGVEIGDDWDVDIMDLQFVWGRDGMNCQMHWDPNLSMGEYSLTSGSESVCKSKPNFYPDIGSNYYVDPIGAVFFDNATAAKLEQEAQEHGYPTIEHDGEQRFWEARQCSFEDVDAREERGWTCGFPDKTCESWHFRAEVGAEKVAGWSDGHVRWGTFAVATPHFDDDDNTCGHFVPAVFPYPDELYSGFSGSGFKAGTYWLVRQFVWVGGHGAAATEDWGNTQPIHQSCGDNQWPAGDGLVYYILIL